MIKSKYFLGMAILSFATGFLLTGCSPASESSENSHTADQKATNENINTTGENINISSQEIDISAWKTYVNNKYHFQLKYPDTFDLEEKNTPQVMIAFSKDGKAAWSLIFPEGAENGRSLEDPIKTEQIVSGKKAIREEWIQKSGSGTISYKFIEPITNWKMCGESIYCSHINLFAQDKNDLETVKKIFSTFEFIQK